MDIGGTALDTWSPAWSERKARDWVMSIRDDLKQAAQNKKAGPRPGKVMFRVRRQLREIRPEHYAADEFSFGLFDRSPMGPGKSRAEKCMFLMASATLEVMGMTEDDWEKFCAMVVPNPKEIQDLYDEVGRDPLSLHEVQSVLTLDAVFIACFLGTLFHEPFAALFPSLRSAVDPMTTNTMKLPLLKDLFKVENQIPLSLIRVVLLILVEKGGVDLDKTHRIQLADDTLSAICVEALVQLSFLLPGCDPEDPYSSTQGIPFPFLETDTFLDCMYRVMCRGLKHTQDQAESSPSAPQSFPRVLPSVTELRKAGIEFRGRKGCFHDIDFKAGLLKGTLYLPTLNLADDSYVIWRNLVAYEDAQHYETHDFSQYLNLMDKLIDSSCDVMVLKSGAQPVFLEDRLGTNKEVVRLFNDTVLQNAYWGPNEKWSKLHQQIYDFYKDNTRQMWLEFLGTYLGKPWLRISVMAATMLLVMTLLQTYYTMAGYYRG